FKYRFNNNSSPRSVPASSLIWTAPSHSCTISDFNLYSVFLDLFIYFSKIYWSEDKSFSYQVDEFSELCVSE
ncbi:hypothetical protein LINPERPRIM_LOCUS33319, partial [Linum perenne]